MILGITLFCFFIARCFGEPIPGQQPLQNTDTNIEEAEDLLKQLVELRDRRVPDNPNSDEAEDAEEFVNEWVVEAEGGEEVAKAIAISEGYTYVRKVRNLDNFYVFEKKNLKRHKREAVHLTRSLTGKANVKWAEQQKVIKRKKRDFQDDTLFNDPLWPLQWQLHDRRVGQRTDMNVVGAWQKGYTGEGIVVSILDDGIQHNHTDIIQNYDPLGSYDLNDNDPDPMPTFDDSNRHGTRCAGEVVMAANNSFCGVGIAYGAKIAGIRMLDGRITDRLESEAMNYAMDHVSIYSASWGPNDDGKTVEGPGRLAQEALYKGITEGRGGKGSIFVWASGNGGHRGDDCDCDGYTDSVFTFSVSSAAQDGTFPWYGEMCASTITTTYSTGYDAEKMIATTDIGNECTTDHSGTSASAPLAAGIIAMGLQANPSLTWRDVQHIAVWTSEPAPLLHNDGWAKNGAGLYTNTRFGFGIMNALAFVEAARTWKNVPQQQICTTTFPTFTKRSLNGVGATAFNLKTDACQGETNEINYVEHMQLILDITYPIRGHLAIFVTSPKGTRTQLLSVRREDKSQAGFRSWPFMSVHSWGESGCGRWKVEVTDKVGLVNGDGSVNNITLMLYGTREMPEHYLRPREYDMHYNNFPAEGTKKQGHEEIVRRTRRTLMKNIDKLSNNELDNIIRRLDYVIQRQPAKNVTVYDIDDYASS